MMYFCTTASKTSSANNRMSSSFKEAPGPVPDSTPKKARTGRSTPTTKKLGSDGGRLFDMARNCSGMERTGCSASLARRVKIDMICEESGGMKADKPCRILRSASTHGKLALFPSKFEERRVTCLLPGHILWELPPRRT